MKKDYIILGFTGLIFDLLAFVVFYYSIYVVCTTISIIVIYILLLIMSVSFFTLSVDRWFNS